jgi:hypothetical protein
MRSTSRSNDMRCVISGSVRSSISGVMRSISHASLSVFPKEEFIRNGENGMLMDFFDGDALVDTACTLLEDRMPAARLGAAARQTAVEQYDLATVCLPRQLAWLDEVVCA